MLVCPPVIWFFELHNARCFREIVAEAVSR